MAKKKTLKISESKMDVFVRLLVTAALLNLLHESLEQIYFYLVVLNCSSTKPITNT